MCFCVRDLIAPPLPRKRGTATGELEFMDVWYPIQVKQKDRVGRPDIDSFEAVMMREDPAKCVFAGPLIMRAPLEAQSASRLTQPIGAFVRHRV